MVSRGVAKKRVPAAKKAQGTLAQKLAASPAVRGKQPAVVQARKPAKPASGGGIKNQHTLMLVQLNSNNSSRKWDDFPTLDAALDDFISQYEKQLRKLNPQIAQLTYTVQDLHTYADSLHDVSAMMLDPVTKQYKPQGRPYIKHQLLERLRKQAQ